MSKRSLFAVGLFAGSFSMSGAAWSAPSYCPGPVGAACGGRDIGDILIGLHYNGRILGINPSTGALYVYSTALEQFSNVELGDIAVVPGDPLKIVAIGNVDSGIGIRQIDSCGSLTSAVYGPFPQQFSPPVPPYDKGGMIGRGVAFNPLNGKLYSPDRATPLLNDQTLHHVIFTFPQGGGPFSLALASTTSQNPIQPGPPGLVAADELGSLYIGMGNRIAQIPVAGIEGGAPFSEEYSLTGDPIDQLTDMVADGEHHLYVGGKANGQGVIWRVDTLTGVAQVWANSRGPSYGNEPYNGFQGITIDAAGNILAVETFAESNQRAGVAVISKENGSLLQYFQLPLTFVGASAAWGQPWGIAVLGVNLPTVREACSSDCGSGYITDCFGACMPAGWLGDDFCDEGPQSNMTCWARGFDSGDCNDCPADQVPDCNGHCGPRWWVGDSICDAGNQISYFNGEYISYDCEEYRFDEVSCRGCGPGEKLDCNGNCSPSAWFADGTCDDGGWWYLDHPVDYRCVEYDFDGNDCPVGG